MAFHSPNLEAIRQKVKEAEERKERSDIRFQKVLDGNNRFFILPPYNERGLFVKYVYTHFNLGNSGKEVCYCPQRSEPTKRWECPVCFVLNFLKEAQVPVKGWEATGRSHANVLVLQAGDKEADAAGIPYLPHILQAPVSVGDHINDKVLDPYFDGFYNPENAIPFQVERKKKKGSNRPQDVKYEPAFLPVRMAFSDDQETMDDIAKNMYDLDKVFRYKEDTYTKAIQLANELLDSNGFEPLTAHDYPAYPAELLVSEVEPTEERTENAKDAPEEPATPAPKARAGVGPKKAGPVPAKGPVAVGGLAKKV